jgi:hypothetical protein
MFTSKSRLRTRNLVDTANSVAFTVKGLIHTSVSVIIGEIHELMAQSGQDEVAKSDIVDALKEVDGPVGAVSSSLEKKVAPPEPVQSVTLRRLVIFSFWAIVVFLGLPIWWWTTAIYRARLPLGQMMDWADGRVSWQLRFLLVADMALGLSAGLSTPDIYRCRFTTGS